MVFIEQIYTKYHFRHRPHVTFFRFPYDMQTKGTISCIDTCLKVIKSLSLIVHS
jgi:hypothetical protein